MECALIYPSDLRTIVETNIYKVPYPGRLQPFGPLNKTLEWSLVLGKTAGSYCNLLLVSSGHEFY